MMLEELKSAGWKSMVQDAFAPLPSSRPHILALKATALFFLMNSKCPALTPSTSVRVLQQTSTPPLFVDEMHNAIWDTTVTCRTIALSRGRTWPNGVKLAWDRHLPEDDLGEGCQAGQWPCFKQ
jgi:hypothetical protein